MAQKTVSYTTGVTPGSYTTANVTVDRQGLITTVASGTPTTPSNVPFQLAPSDYDASWLAWTSDPEVFTVTTALHSTTGTLRIATIKLSSPLSVTNVVLWFATNTATFTAAGNWVGLYQGNTLIASSADQTAAWQGSGTGAKVVPLVGAPIAVSAGLLTIAVVSTASAGTTNTIGYSPQNLNLVLTAPNLRTGFSSAVTTLPANLNAVTAVSTLIFAALS